MPCHGRCNSPTVADFCRDFVLQAPATQATSPEARGGFQRSQMMKHGTFDVYFFSFQKLSVNLFVFGGVFLKFYYSFQGWEATKNQTTNLACVPPTMLRFKKFPFFPFFRMANRDLSDLQIGDKKVTVIELPGRFFVAKNKVKTTPPKDVFFFCSGKSPPSNRDVFKGFQHKNTCKKTHYKLMTCL